MSRKEQLLYMVDIIDGIKEGSIEGAINFAKSNGIEQNMHLGNTEEWFNEDRDSRVAEWIMGQFIDGYENRNFLGYNSGINISRSFLAGKY